MRKDNKKKTIILITVCLIVVFIFITLTKHNTTTINKSIDNEVDINDETKEVVADGIWEISKYGNVKINVSHEKVLEAFEYGDILTVKFNDTSVDVPLVQSFSEVDSGVAGLFLQMDNDVEETELAINMGNFAENYLIANKIVHEDKSYEWQYCDGVSDSTVFTITMKEKAGYLDQYIIRSMTFTNERDDYQDLTDEEFANFRLVSAGEISEGMLFRSSSPINPENGRNIYADLAAKNAYVNVFVDLADNEDAIMEYEGVENSYFITKNHIAVCASADFKSQETSTKLAEAFKYMANNPGIYCIFCDEGKDRSGIMIAILESLMGASYDEIAKDYMLSFTNYYNIKENDKAYKVTLNGALNKTLMDIFGTDPETADLKAAAENYLLSLGLDESEISQLKDNLIMKE